MVNSRNFYQEYSASAQSYFPGPKSDKSFKEIISKKVKIAL